MGTQKHRGSLLQNQCVAAALSDNRVWPRLPMEQTHGWRECRQSSLPAQWEMLHQTVHMPSTLPAPGYLGIRGAWRKEDVWPLSGSFDLGWDLLDSTASSKAPHCSVCAWNMSLSLSQTCTGSTCNSHFVPSGRGSELPWSELAFGEPRLVFCIISNSKTAKNLKLYSYWAKCSKLHFPPGSFNEGIMKSLVTDNPRKSRVDINLHAVDEDIKTHTMRQKKKTPTV